MYLLSLDLSMHDEKVYLSYYNVRPKLLLILGILKLCSFMLETNMTQNINYEIYNDM